MTETSLANLIGLTLPTWMDKAACAGADDVYFFPPKGGRIHIDKGVEMCNQCPVKAECLRYALEHERNAVMPGIYGGLVPEERNRIQICANKDCKNTQTLGPTEKRRTWHCSTECEEYRYRYTQDHYNYKNGWRHISNG